MPKIILICALMFVVNPILSQTNLQLSGYFLDQDYSVVTMEEANKAFQTIKNTSILEFSYTRGGCDYRAEAVYLLLKKLGIKTFKIWNFAASKIFIAGQNFNNHNLLLQVRDKLNLSTTLPYYKKCNISISDKVTWGYHVAPVIVIMHDNRRDTMVIDPALFETPIEYHIWLKEQLQANGSSYFSFLNGNYISFQTESQYQNNGIYCSNCSGNDIITGIFYTDDYSISVQWIEQSISKGKVIVEYYKKEIEPLEKKLLTYPSNTTNADAISLACKIANMKQIASSENGFSNLPKEYQDKFEAYVKEAKKILY